MNKLCIISIFDQIIYILFVPNLSAFRMEQEINFSDYVPDEWNLWFDQIKEMEEFAAEKEEPMEHENTSTKYEEKPAADPSVSDNQMEKDGSFEDTSPDKDPFFRTPFSVKDDLLLAKNYLKYKTKWLQYPLNVYETPKNPSKLKNRYYSFTRKRENLSTMCFIMRDLETTAQIEEYPTDALEPFRQMIPEKKARRRY